MTEQELMDLNSFLLKIYRAEAAAPILDPTLFIQAGDNLNRIRRLAEALRPFHTEVLAQMESVL